MEAWPDEKTQEVALSAYSKILAALSAGALVLSLTGCAATYTEADFGGYKSCSPSFIAPSSAGRFTIQQAGAGQALQWGAYPNSAYSGVKYHVIVTVNGKKYDEKTQAYAPHGSIDRTTANKNRGKKVQIRGEITRAKDIVRFTIGCIIK